MMAILSLRIVAVSGDSRRQELLDRLLDDENDYGTIFVESFADAYSRIKNVTPDLIVLLLEPDDIAGCRLLSMLTNDTRLSTIPFVTCMSTTQSNELEDRAADITRDAARHTVAGQIN